MSALEETTTHPDSTNDTAPPPFIAAGIDHPASDGGEFLESVGGDNGEDDDDDEDSLEPVSSSKLDLKNGQKKKTSSMSAAPSGSQSGDRGPQGENTGRWTAEEHSLFLQGLELHGKGWKKIAQLIKSRTVVQIRTHAQKYFQKLTKARQNGEEGEVIMEGRGGVSSVASASPTAVAHSSKRRRLITGTKRKAIQSVVSSSIRQGKKMAAAQAAAGVEKPVPPLPAIAPVLAHFILPPARENSTSNSRQFEDQTTISGQVLEDSIFRFLTPAPISSELPLNDIARQAGANPITLPTETANSPSTAAAGGEISPTGVTEMAMYPSWVDGKDPPSWYAKGLDVDALLEVGDTLDWLADSGDLHETYEHPAAEEEEDEVDVEELAKNRSGKMGRGGGETLNNVTSVATLPHVESVVPPLPSLFGDTTTTTFTEELDKPEQNMATATLELSTSTTSMDEHLQVFESHMEEHDFVSTILETNNESAVSLPALQ